VFSLATFAQFCDQISGGPELAIFGAPPCCSKMLIPRTKLCFVQVVSFIILGRAAE
jgi:hypothetical protein